MPLYKSHFYHGLIKKYTVVMGSILSGLDVVKYKPDGTENIHTRVPLTYSKKEKWVRRLLEETADLTRQPAITLPRISFELSDLSYDPGRKLSSKRYFAFTNQDADDTKLKIMMPVPWNFHFDAYIIAKTQEDMLQIIEQIAPFFTPDYTVSMNGIKNPAVTFDTPISLLSVNPSDTAEGGFEQNRLIIWQMRFVMRGYLFGPINKKGIIKEVDVKIMDYDELAKEPSLRNYMIDIGMRPFIDGVPLEDIGPDDPWTLEIDIDIQQ